jgi:hypothetical protein
MVMLGVMPDSEVNVLNESWFLARCLRGIQLIRSLAQQFQQFQVGMIAAEPERAALREPVCAAPACGSHIGLLRPASA